MTGRGALRQTLGTAEEHTQRGKTKVGGKRPLIETFPRIPPVVRASSKYLSTAHNMSLPFPAVSSERATYQRCLSEQRDTQCFRQTQGSPLYVSVWFPQKHLGRLVCPSSKEVKHGLSLLQHKIVGIMEQRRRRMWSGDPPVRTSKQRGSGGSIRQT